MNPDDRLRQALHDEADEIEPGDDGWDRIQSWAATAERRTRLRRGGLMGLAAVAMIAIVVGAVALTNDEAQRVDTQPPAGSQTTDQPAKTSVPEEASTSTSLPGPSGDTSSAVWPVGASTYSGPVEAATAFMRDYVGMPNPVAGEFLAGDPRSGEVKVRPRADLEALTTTVLVRQLDGEHWWTVAAVSDNLQVALPIALDPISSPMTVTGAASAFEGNVLVEVRQDGQGRGENLGQAPVTGSGSAERGPFKGNIEFSTPTTEYGALVLTTASAEDDSIEQATVLRIRFAPPATNESCSPPVPNGRTVKVFLLCEEQSATAVERVIGERQDVLSAAIELLLIGATTDEEATGLFSLFSDKTAGMLNSVTIRSDGTAVVDFSSEIKAGLPTVGTSAGSAAVIRQLNPTVFQFDTVQRVEYLLDGSCEAFWEWHQAACEDNSPVTRESAED